MSKELHKQWMIGHLAPLIRILWSQYTTSVRSGFYQDVCREWKIEDKNSALVTDNANNMILAGAGAKMNPHVQCVAHTLNLAS